MRSYFQLTVLAVFGLLTFVSCSNKSTSSNAESNSTLTSDSLFNLNEGWDYLEEGLVFEEAKKATFTDKVDLPHCWNALDAVDAVPGYRRDKSWYKKTLTLEGISSDLNYILYFEGSNLKTEVFINGEKAGEHIGGYVGFEIDITSKLKEAKNEILISVDNSVDRELIPSQKSDFFIYGGITRDLWLKIQPKTAFKDVYPIAKHIGDGVFDVEISIDDNNDEASYVALLKKDGEVKAQQTITGGKGAISGFEPEELWSLEKPSLYELEIQKLEAGNLVYSKSKPLGFRYFEFVEKGAFYLNGKRVLIRGTHRHEEHAGVAAAMTNEMHYNDLKIIKDMGANFVRLAHYPQDPEVYKACDELGLLVWDELPWCRGGLGNEAWQNTAKRLLEEQIYQNLHHPSIITWSMGNEMYWDEDFEGGGAIEPLRVFLKELCDLTKSIDDTRPTSIRKFYEGADIVDLFSPSIWAGWYRGKYGEYEEALMDSKEKYPRYVHMEYGAASHMGRHDEKELSVDIDGGWEEDLTQVGVSNMSSKGTWSETYAVDLFDWHLHVSENLEDFTGNAQWAFKDFGTPLRPENPIPYINQKGILDRSGKFKDSYYVFRSYWDTLNAFAYIQSHSWTERFGEKGEEKVIRVYSNCETVELFLNGESLGVKTRNKTTFPAHGLNWKVKFVEGKNELSAKAIKAESEVSDEIGITYSTTLPNKAAEIELASIEENGLIKITATMVDGDGVVCQEYRKRFYFTVNGGAKLIENLGTNDGSSIIEPMNGTVSIYVKPHATQESILECRNQDFKGSYIVIPSSGKLVD